MIQIGINGFGRIGRVILRAFLQKSDLEITAINDPAIDVEYISYLIKFDSTHGKYMGSVRYTKDEIFVDDKPIKIFRENRAPHIPWHTAGVQYVVECSGMFTTLEKASGHLASASVRHVIVTAPSVDIPMIILGVNDGEHLPGQKVISCASSTLYCLAPIIKILEDGFGVSEGFVTSIHAMTPSLKPIDGFCLRGKHWRDHRGIHQNIIPATTGVCRALGKIIPQVKDKLAAIAFRVPIVNVSVLDITIRLSLNTTMQEIILKIQNARTSMLENIITISNEHVVSSDFMGETHSCVLDVDSSIQLKSNFFKFVCWYENEYSYACRVIDSIYFLERKLTKLLITKCPKEISVEETQCQKEFINSTSQNNGLKFKTPSRMMLSKKPLSSHHQNTAQPLTVNNNIKKDEAFKCCNEEKQQQKPTIKQNMNSMFQCSDPVSPHNREEFDCEKAQERLQILKEEFSKLVKITESLLKKSYPGNKRSRKPEENPRQITNIVAAQNASSEDNSKVYRESCTEVKGDIKEAISNTFSCKRKTFGKENLEEPYFPMKAVTRPISVQYKSTIHQYIKHDDNIEFYDERDNNMNNSISNATEMILKCSEKSQIATIMQSRDVQKQITKDTKNITRNEEMSIDFPQKALVEYRVTEKNITKNKDREAKTTNKHINSNGSPYVLNNMVCTSKCYLQTDDKNHSPIGINKNNKLVDEEKYEYLDNKSRDTLENKELIKECMDVNKMNYPNNLLDNHTEPNIKCDNSPTLSITSYGENSNKSMLGVRRFSPERISLLSDRTSKNRSPDNTSFISNTEVYKHKEDIYDKLDSVSDTDSSNSFQIKERKSQVINITDLTTSLEDFSRLDKICKIIEISDELSDKLFSALDSEDGIPIRKKKWSFKDLCERIKLDDFCDNLCEKSSL